MFSRQSVNPEVGTTGSQKGSNSLESLATVATQVTELVFASRLNESLFCGLLGFKHFGCLVNLLIQLGGSNTSEHGLILLKPFDFIKFVSSVFYLQTRLSLIVEHKPFVIRHVFVRSMNTKDFSQKFGRLQSLVHLFQ